MQYRWPVLALCLPFLTLVACGNYNENGVNNAAQPTQQQLVQQVCSSPNVIVSGQTWVKGSDAASSLTLDANCALDGNGITSMTCSDANWTVTYGDGSSQTYTAGVSGIYVALESYFFSSNPNQSYYVFGLSTAPGVGTLSPGEVMGVTIYFPTSAYASGTLPLQDASDPNSPPANGALVTLMNFIPQSSFSYGLGLAVPGQITVAAAGSQAGQPVAFQIDGLALQPVANGQAANQLLCPDGAYHVMNVP